MGFQLFLRICHSTKNIQRHARNISSKVKFSSFFVSTLAASILVCNSLHAEPNVSSNVAGDEIIIYSDDSYKPAMRDFGSIENPVQNDIIQKKQLKKMQALPIATTPPHLMEWLPVMAKVYRPKVHEAVALATHLTPA